MTESGVTLVKAIVNAKDGGHKAIEVEGGGTLGETAAKAFCNVLGNSQHMHTVGKAFNRDTWEGAFYVKEKN